MLTPFQNELYVHFTEERPRRKMQEALQRTAVDLGRTYHLVIGGERVESDSKTLSYNPAHPEQIIGMVYDANTELTDLAVHVAGEAFRSWSRYPAETRARYLMKAAAVIRRRAYEFAAWDVYEASKNWNEAYAEVCEAIDYLEYYAREAIRWSEPQPVSAVPGEENEVAFRPLGVGAIIAPWSSPLAALVNMTAAAIAAGNTVVVKPAEQTPVLAAKFFEVLEIAGLPEGVVNFLPGHGEVVGEALTGHAGIRFVAFTGSKEVGLHVYQRIAVCAPGQRWLKKGIIEMGGKGAIIVDSGINTRAAAQAVISSAFGYQGQKCSACSRLIVHTAIYEELINHLLGLASKITVGDPVDPSVYMGALIDQESYDRVKGYIALCNHEGKLILGGEESVSGYGSGHLVGPVIAGDVDPQARIAQEEIFGPVLSVIRARDFSHALEIANGSEFGLTGSVFSNNREHLDQARYDFEVGNLYFNRKCTGAMVGAQPFGGFNMSGMDTKSGGRDYLGLYMQAKTVTERW